MTTEDARVQPVELGRRLQTFRRLSGRTQMDIAEALGLSRPSIAAIEAGQRRLSGKLLLELAKAYGVQLSDLVREAPVMASLQAQFRLPSDATPAERSELDTAIAALQTLSAKYLHL
jgi:transcriptional regulator with XRE-family HTH domain